MRLKHRVTGSIFLCGLLLSAGCPVESAGEGEDDGGGVSATDATVDGGTADGAGGDAPVHDDGAMADAATAADAASSDDAAVGDDAVVAADAFTGTDASAGTDASVGADAATGSDAAAGTDAAVGTDAATGPSCSSDRQCDPGFICEPDQCVEGCRSEADCPFNAQQCATQLGANGQCVQCLLPEHCEPFLDMCVDYSCTTGCDAQTPCSWPLICDEPNSICVRCLNDDQCGFGTICEDNDCIPGCRIDDDCFGAQICNNGACVEGCRSTPNDTCPINSHCDPAQSVCVPGCGSDDDQCPQGRSCVDNACVASCADTDACPDGQHCDSGSSTCVEGCWDASAGVGNCGFGQVCDPGDGMCVGCYPGDQSTCVTPLVCDELNRNCVVQCSTPEYTFACETAGGYCDTNRDNLCVGCLDDTHCGAFEHCDTSHGVCVGDTARPLCAPCDGDAQCGGSGDLCVQLNHGFMLVERVCGTDCSSGQACAPGTRCTDVGEPVRGRQCLPHNTVMDLSTCRAYMHTASFKECSSNWECGMTRNRDAICSDAGLSAGHCSMLCDPGVADECPGIQAVCQDPGGNDAPRCGPPV